MKKCIKCNDEEIYHQQNGLGYRCYQTEYRKGTIPKNPANWNVDGPYEGNVDWLKNLEKLFFLNSDIYYDSKREVIIYVLKNKNHYKKNIDGINFLKQILKKANFEVRDIFGNYVTFQHDFLRRKRGDVKVPV